MKFVDKLVEKALDVAPQLKTLKEHVDDAEKRFKSEIIEVRIKMNENLIEAIEYMYKVQDNVAAVKNSVESIITTLELHQKAITDLYAAINAVTSVINDKRSSAMDLPDIKKVKDEKPN